MENGHLFLCLLTVAAMSHFADGEYCGDDIYCSNGCCDGYCCYDDELSGGVIAAIVVGSILGIALKICCWIAICRYFRRPAVTVVQMAPTQPTTTVVSSSTIVPMSSNNPYHAGYDQSRTNIPMPAPPPRGPPPAYA